MINKLDELIEVEPAPKRKLLREPDPHFSHLFKELRSEYLVDGDDGNYVQMECSTWLDLSAEAAYGKTEEPEWVTDFSLVNVKEARNVPFMKALTDTTANQLLQPIKGLCVTQAVDIWNYTIC